MFTQNILWIGWKAEIIRIKLKLLLMKLVNKIKIITNKSDREIFAARFARAETQTSTTRRTRAGLGVIGSSWGRRHSIGFRRMERRDPARQSGAQRFLRNAVLGTGSHPAIHACIDDDGRLANACD